MNDFDIALDFTLRWEGFVSDDPNDEGGMTIFGISKRSHPKAVMGMHQLILEGKKEEAFQIAKKYITRITGLAVVVMITVGQSL